MILLLKKNCSVSQILRNKSLFNQHDSSLICQVNAASRKVAVYYKTKNPLVANNCMIISFQLFLYIMNVKSQEDQ